MGRVCDSMKKQELLRKIKDFRLFDDNFMSKVFEDNDEGVELLLHIIMEMPELKVIKLRTQYSIKNLLGRSVRLDIDAIDATGKKYNIEVQRADKGAGVKRARYNSSVIDANALLPGSDFEDLPETYVIFITENDVLGGDKPIYHIERMIQETGQNFNDEEHIIYVNGTYRGDTPLGRLMHDFSCKNPDDMYYKILANRTRYYKEDEEGVSAMCRIMEELIDSEKREIVLRMLADGKLSCEKIAEYAGISIEVVNDLKNEL